MLSIDALLRPINDLIATVGSGNSETDPVAMLRSAGSALAGVLSVGAGAASEVAGAWQSAAAQAALAKSTAAQTSTGELAQRSEEIGTTISAALEVVARGAVELEGIAASFVSIAVAAAPTLATPPGQLALLGVAIEHLTQALAVVAQIRSELSVHTAHMTELTSDIPVPSAPGAEAAGAQALGTASTVATSLGAGATPVSTVGLQSSVLSTTPASLGAGSGPAYAPVGTIGGAATAPAAFAPPRTAAPGAGMSSLFGGGAGQAINRGGAGQSGGAPAVMGARPDIDPRNFGDGVEVYLPDGSKAMAPNAAAADAVRNALSQRGVPYVWGGNQPGVGLDCSGLTKWAYGQAGVDLPRLAQEQNVGMRVDQGSVLPGDLAVWDGHVAMVIGNGQMVEAGDPVSVSPIRTSNIGMGFYGFYRPTAK